ncbi:MAG: efflux RND transporter permease subunit, partial [Verrucomicrobia bacterium]|nr:efflux RND transporter permease subunit [Verrucomicrobiota bacterium]
MKSAQHYSKRWPSSWRLVAGMVALAFQLGAAPEARAYVFASNVQLGGTNANLTTTAGESVTINYLLNQPANAGVTVAVVSGTNVLWNTNLFTTGTNQGVNSVLWDGNDLAGNPASNGLWHVTVQAASSGFTNWTRVRIKSNGGSSAGDGYVWGPQGIAVNNNTNSPYFGRVFVGNAEATFGPAPGDLVGIAKYNADGSDAAEGPYSTGTFAVGAALPGKIEVGADDRVYIVDSASDSRVLSFDQLISTNPAPLQVLTLGNLAVGASYSGLSVSGSGTNRKIYLSDVNGTAGVRVWNMPSGTVSPADTGTTAVAAGPSFDLNLAPQDVALDSSGKVFAIQSITGFNSWPRALGYAAFQGATLTNSIWTHSNFGMLQAAGTAAALHTNFLAVVCEVDNGDAISLFNRTDGSPVNGDGLNNFNEFSRTWQVNVQAEGKFRSNPEDIGKLYVRGKDGRLVELSSVIRIQEGGGPTTINRVDRQRALILFAGLENKPLGQAMTELDGISAKILTSEFTAVYKGMAETMGESFKYLIFALILGIVM